MPELEFKIIDADVISYAAAPTLLFRVNVRNKSQGETIHAVQLRTQIRIDVTRRKYDPDEQEGLVELFGEPKRWGETLRSMLWTHTTENVSGFADSASIEMPVTCTYDFDVATSKYFHAVEDGTIPLLFLFSGTVFYGVGDGPLQIGQIGWDTEARFDFPAHLWHDMMKRYFPNTAWLRIRKDLFDQLYEYRTAHGYPTWDQALDTLLAGAEKERR
jgi:hypothetical protein